MYFTNNLFVEALSGSALTLHDTNNWAVEEATCLAEDINFSSLDIPWTKAFADSTKLWVAAATRRDADIRPSDHWPSSELVNGLRLTYGNNGKYLYIIYYVYNCRRLTFPESMSSRCAADAAFTRADVAAAMDLAASKITSSKFHEASGVSYTQTTRGNYFVKRLKISFLTNTILILLMQ